MAHHTVNVIIRRVVLYTPLPTLRITHHTEGQGSCRSRWSVPGETSKTRHFHARQSMAAAVCLHRRVPSWVGLMTRLCSNTGVACVSLSRSGAEHRTVLTPPQVSEGLTLSAAPELSHPGISRFSIIMHLPQLHLLSQKRLVQHGVLQYQDGRLNGGTF